jgi:hypothetical protein
VNLRRTARAATAALLGVAALAMPASANAAGSGLDAYKVKTDAAGIARLSEAGFDMTEARHGSTVEIIGTAKQMASLRDLGLKPVLKRNKQGLTARQFAARSVAADGSYDVYRPYYNDACTDETCYVGRDDEGEPRQTLYEEMQQLAADHREIVKPVIIGHTLNGVPILALKITKDARQVPDGSRPAILYSSNQHAREWITPEMNRRLAHMFAENYTTSGDSTRADGESGDPLSSAAGDVTKGDITKLITENELWIVISANPDGYDFTFTPGNRLWRKNLREINHEPGIQAGDGVDPNRNFATKWNYDNEGSASDTADETYRGTGPNSEPETQAMDGLLRRIGFKMQINYHSAAELLLYPYGFQVETYTADDPIYRALSGTDEDSAVKGVDPGAPNNYDPDVGAELYTTNGETTDHAHGTYGTLAWTPEMDVADEDRGAEGEDGGPASDFEFQDRDDDLQQAFEKNVPFALDVAKSAADPANPTSHLGNKVLDFEVERFARSYGDPQAVEANVKRELGDVSMHYRINGGPEQTVDTEDWKGGERYGAGYDIYYHRVRGVVTGTNPGDEVRAWFEAGGKRSPSFSYDAVSESANKVLILASEDYSGHSPDYADPTKPKYLSYYEQALQANGVGYDVYDIDATNRTAPDNLGVLSHYDAIVWYTGDNQRTIEPDQPATGAGASKLADDEFREVRDFLNEGGKLLYTGKKAGFNLVNQYVFNVEDGPPYCDSAAAPCIPLSNDFLQYYLGSFSNNVLRQSKEELDGVTITFPNNPFGPRTVTMNGGDSADNQDYAYTLTPTSTILPADVYPQFASKGISRYSIPGPLAPNTGDWYMFSQPADHAYKRLSRTVDLTAATAGTLKFKTTYDAEPDYDFMFVEAHTVGQDDWTTLPDENGHTDTAPGSSCTDGWSTSGGTHPFLSHYQTNEGDTCTSTGETGEWNATTGNSGGYEDWEIDLSQFAGREVEVSITYATDPFVQGIGVFVDDTDVLVDGTSVASTSFEEDQGGWTVGGPPEGSEGNPNNWIRSQSLFEEAAGVTTEDTVYFGFGLEGIRDAAERSALMKSSLTHLGVLSESPGNGNPGNGNPGNGNPGNGNPGNGNPGNGPKRSIGIRKRTLQVGNSRRFKVVLRCPPSEADRCKGLARVVSGRKVLGRRSFSVKAGKYRSVTLKMTRKQYRELVKRGRYRATVTVTSRDDAGTLRSKAVRLTIRPAKAKTAT